MGEEDDFYKKIAEPYNVYFGSLFENAFKVSPVQTLYTVLRVSGLQDANWDPFEESIAEIEDFNRLMAKAKNEENKKTVIRIALLMYCQLIEMTVPHEMIMNLLRCLAKEPYIMKPFSELVKRIKKTSFRSIPPSASRKFQKIREKAELLGEVTLVELIDSFFNDNIRNAFSHSDFVLTDSHFRWTEGGLAQQIEIDKVKELFNNCFAFYDALLFSYNQWLAAMATCPKYHKWPNYEVLEILTENKKVCGFSVHFSNGYKATYKRTTKGTECMNIRPDKDGSVNFFVEPLDELEPVWKINGEPVKDGEISIQGP